MLSPRFSRLHLRRLWTLVACAMVASPGCRKDPEPAPLPPAQCAKVPRGQDEPIEEVTCAGSDADGDGVDDAVDLCPELEETRDGVADKDGCPDPDGDEDGVVDTSDGCPGEKGPPPDGCPVKDIDGDGIPDHLDACPTRPEDKDGVQDADGCPEGERGATVGEVLRTTWRDGVVQFRRRKATPTDEGARVLAAIIDEVDGAPTDVALITIAATTHPREARRRSQLKAIVDERVGSIVDTLKTLGVPEAKIETKTTVLPRRARRQPGEVAIVLWLSNEAAARRLNPQDGGVVDAGEVDGGAPPPIEPPSPERNPDGGPKAPF